MAKNSVRDYSATNSSNTDIQSIDISEGCSPAGINNAVREIMVDLKNVSTGAVDLETPSADQLNVDNLRLDGNTISSTDTNGDITIDPDGTGDTIIASGSVGIGTSSPDSLVHLSGANPKLHIRNSSDSNRGGYLQDNGTTFVLGTNSGVRNLVFSPDNTERMRIDSAGQIMMHKSSLGVTTAGHEFRNTGVAIHSVNNNTCMELVRFGGTGRLQEFYSTSTLVGNISTNGSSTSYNTSSDARLKENVTYDWDATTRLKQLKPARFNFIADADTTVDGFLAHEAQAVVPEAVTGTHNEVDDDGNPVMQGIDQAKIVPLLTKALIESVEKIEQLEARITALEAE